VFNGLSSPDLVTSVGWDQKRGMTLDEFLVHGAMVLGAEGRWDGDTGSLELSVKFNRDEDAVKTPYTARLSASWAGKSVEIDPVRNSLLHEWPEMKPLGKAMGGALFLRLSPRQLAAPSYLEEAVPALGPDGEGLASVLNDLASSAPEATAAIEEALRAVVPSVRRVRTERGSGSAPTGAIGWSSTR
jgi:hypothetical protein